MKIMHEQIKFPDRSPIRVKLREMPYFTYPWHFHSEYEILYVIDGFGTRFVADTVEPFQSGELALLGSNLPHFWRSDELYRNSEGKLKVKYIVIQFPADFLKDQINNYPEYRLIARLLQRASRGIRFSDKFTAGVQKKVLKVAHASGFERMMLLQKLLQTLAETNEYRLLAGELYQHEDYGFTNERLAKVMHHITTSYQNKIELEKVADIANLHPSAFCRYFKQKTGKSLSEFVNEMRISYACRLVLENKMTVTQICFECGFNNISNFNRTFKRQTGYTPTRYFAKFHGQ